MRLEVDKINYWQEMSSFWKFNSWNHLQSSFQLSNVDADGEVVMSLLSTKSIVTGIPLVELKMPHRSGDADIHCYDVRLPSNITDNFAVVRVQVKLIFCLICLKAIVGRVSCQALEQKGFANFTRSFKSTSLPASAGQNQADVQEGSTPQSYYNNIEGAYIDRVRLNHQTLKTL